MQLPKKMSQTAWGIALSRKIPKVRGDIFEKLADFSLLLHH
jgi:hypothetical protein